MEFELRHEETDGGLYRYASVIKLSPEILVVWRKLCGFDERNQGCLGISADCEFN